MYERIPALLRAFARLGRELGPGVPDGVNERTPVVVSTEAMVETQRRALRAPQSAFADTIDGYVITPRCELLGGPTRPVPNSGSVEIGGAAWGQARPANRIKQKNRVSSPF